VDAIVQGTVAEEGARVRVTVNLLPAGSDRAIWSGTYVRSMANVLTLQAEVARGLARAIGLDPASAPSEPPRPLARVSPRAYQAYLDGSYLERQPNRNFLSARAYLQQAVEQSPEFAPAYLGLSKFYFVLSLHSLSPRQALPLAEQYADQALRLDPSSAAGHLQLGDVEAAEWNWNAADREFRRAIALAPGLASAHMLYADYLDAIGETAPALLQAQRAVQLDPLSPAAHAILAGAAFASGQYERSLEQCQQILLLEPGQPEGYKCMSEILVYAGKYKRSLVDIKEYLAKLPRNEIALTMGTVAYAHLGQMRQAGALLAQLRREGRRRYVSPAYLAAALAAMGNDSAAIADLQQSYASHDDDLVSLKTNLFYRPLAGDPRYQALVREMKYPSHRRQGATEPLTGGQRGASGMHLSSGETTKPNG
jgi:tetratricopeptide (TPR) repeat protein